MTMTTYEYTDICGEKLEVEHRPVTGLVMVSAYTRNEADALVQIHVNVNPDDAPALALAVLEAAGIDPDKDSTTPEAFAVMHLAKWRQHQAEKAEREAEDAKVREFFLALNPGNFIAADVEVDDRVREQYRAARKFFAQEDVVPAEIVDGDFPPRVIETAEDLGAEHWASKWKDTDGCTWELTLRGWGWSTPANPHPRIAEPESFPWTEVLV